MTAQSHPLSLPSDNPFVLAAESAADVAAREALLDAAMGPRRKRKSSEAIRRGRLPAEGLSLVALGSAGELVGTVRLWNIAAGECGGKPVPALLLGPLAVAPSLKGAGIGTLLMQQAVAEAGRFGHRAILLVGDPEYYVRFGFSAARTGALAMPGPFERHRLLALELIPDALGGAAGLIRPTGRRSVREPAAPVRESISGAA